VELENGENWFVHFQDRGAYGRVVHLNPVRWVKGWPEMGVDLDSNGVGEPVTTFEKPAVAGNYPMESPPTSDSFAGPLGLQWQWQGNPRSDWSSLTVRPGWLRLRAIESPPGDLTAAPNELLQKFPSPAFTATTRLDFTPGRDGARAGLVVMGLTHSGILVRGEDDGLAIEQFSNDVAGPAGDDQTHATARVARAPVWLRVDVVADARCQYSYSTDGDTFQPLGKPFVAGPGKWIGAKVGLVCVGEDGYADFDSFEVE
jgi:beta-xylosidase